MLKKGEKYFLSSHVVGVVVVLWMNKSIYIALDGCAVVGFMGDLATTGFTCVFSLFFFCC